MNVGDCVVSFGVFIQGVQIVQELVTGVREVHVLFSVLFALLVTVLLFELYASIIWCICGEVSVPVAA